HPGRPPPASCGAFGPQLAPATDAAPRLESPLVPAADPGTSAIPSPAVLASAGLVPSPAEATSGELAADVFAWPHNETSTGVATSIARPDDIDDDALVVIDATSGAGGLDVDVAEPDGYRSAPQRA